MSVRYALRQIGCGLCILGAMNLSALALTSVDDATQNDVNRGGINLDQRPAKAAPERGTIGNPLWAIPIGSLTLTRDRPLFTPSRRPPAPAVVAPPPAVQAKVAAPPAEPEHPNLTLIGTVVGETEGIGVFLDRSTQGFVRLKTGEEHSGWILRSVKPREATLEKQSQTETLSLPSPQESSGAPRKEPEL
jgi:general secretion pathway protein N